MFGANGTWTADGNSALLIPYISQGLDPAGALPMLSSLRAYSAMVPLVLTRAAVAGATPTSRSFTVAVWLKVRHAPTLIFPPHRQFCPMRRQNHLLLNCAPACLALRTAAQLTDGANTARTFAAMGAYDSSEFVWRFGE